LSCCKTGQYGRNRRIHPGQRGRNVGQRRKCIHLGGKQHSLAHIEEGTRIGRNHDRRNVKWCIRKTMAADQFDVAGRVSGSVRQTGQKEQGKWIIGSDFAGEKGVVLSYPLAGPNGLPAWPFDKQDGALAYQPRAPHLGPTGHRCRARADWPGSA
jgi:hypothetical protein